MCMYITCVRSRETFMQTIRQAVIYTLCIFLSLSLSLSFFFLSLPRSQKFVMPTLRSKRKNLSIIVIDGFKGNVLSAKSLVTYYGTHLDNTTYYRHSTHLRIHLTYIVHTFNNAINVDVTSCTKIK